ILALPPAARNILDAAAILAEPFSLDLLATLLEADPQAVYEQLSLLVTQGYCERLREAEGTVYLIAQRRIQQALYQALDEETDSERRTRLHRRAGEILEEHLWRGEPGLAAVSAAIAEHFWRAGERARSLPYLLRAAGQATAVYGYAQAAALYGRAAEATAETEPAAGIQALAAQAESLAGAGSYARALRVYHDLLRRPDLERSSQSGRLFAAGLLLRKGRLHTRLGEHPMALESHDEGLRLLTGSSTGLDVVGILDIAPEIEIDLLQGKALALRDLADWDAAFQAARAALARAGRGRLERQRAMLLNTLAMLYSDRGDWRRAGRLARRGLWVAERCGDDSLCLTLRTNLANVLWKTGAYEQALDLYRRNLAGCEQTHDLWGELFALNNLGIMEGSRGNWMAAREPLSRSVEVARRLGARENESLSRLNLGEVEEVLGRWPRAERHYERALKLLEDIPDQPDRFTVLAQFASLDRKRGRGSEAERRAREALDGAARIGDNDLLAQCWYQLGL
ncbi:MAG TPA: tetratricopeptide repeat protein, partial [Thermoanaerobaculia bacterium]